MKCLKIRSIAPNRVAQHEKVFGFALEMIFLITKLGMEKEIFFEMSFFKLREWKNKSDSTVLPWGASTQSIYYCESLLLHQLVAS